MTPKAYSRAEVVSSGQITLSDPSVLQHTEDALRHRREIFPKGARMVAEHAVNTSAELLAASKTVPEDIHALITELIAMTMEYAEQENLSVMKIITYYPAKDKCFLVMKYAMV